MRTTFLFSAFVLFYSFSSVAQSYEGKIQYDKKKQDALVIEYAYPAEAVENAMVSIMEKQGYRAKEEKGFLNRDKGFLVFRNAVLTDISDKRMDYVLKVERKSRKESDEAILYLFMLDNDKNVLMTMPSHDLGNAKRFLNDMLPAIEVENLELQIRDQKAIVDKANKKLRDLKDEHDTLEKKISENERNQDATSKDIESQEKALDVLIKKRKQD